MMSKHKIAILCITLISCLLLCTTACHPDTEKVKENKENPTIPSLHETDAITPPETNTVTETKPKTDAVPDSAKTNQPGHEQIFDSQVDWPKFEIQKDSVPTHASKCGTNSSGSWCEGKGYLHFDLEKLVRDMSTLMMMESSIENQKQTQSEVRQTPNSVDYQVHIDIDYIITVAFDLTVHIDIYRDEQNKITDIVYDSQKTSGSAVIKRIHEYFVVHALEDGWFQIEYQSLVNAIISKEDESRAHFEELFSRWEKY